MHRVTRAARALLMPITIMMVPHSGQGCYSLRVPLVGLAIICMLSIMGMGLVYGLVDDALSYEPTKKELEYYKNQFASIEATIGALEMANREFRQLFSLSSKEEVLDNMNFTNTGSIDIDLLKKSIDRTIDNVGEIRDYLSEARDLYMATPLGWPVKGWLTSTYGYRIHPITKARDFHSALDISARLGTEVRATADGVVSFAGRSGANGLIIAVEHGFGYRTLYAHNKKIKVKVGQVVKRGDIIAFVGSTGRSTGPHLHYEIWKNDHSVNPLSYVKGGDWEKLYAAKNTGVSKSRNR